jgi:hypothetical protein
MLDLSQRRPPSVALGYLMDHKSASNRIAPEATCGPRRENEQWPVGLDLPPPLPLNSRSVWRFE